MDRYVYIPVHVRLVLQVDFYTIHDTRIVKITGQFWQNLESLSSQSNFGLPGCAWILLSSTNMVVTWAC